MVHALSSLCLVSPQHSMLLKSAKGRIAAKGAALTIEWGQGIVRRGMFQSELTALKAKGRRAMPLLKTAFKGWKDFNRSRNWHKMDHATEHFSLKGCFLGAGNEEHPENRQKCGHEAYNKYTSRHGNLLPGITRHHSNLAITTYAQRWVENANDDLITLAGCGRSTSVAFLLDGYCHPLMPDPRSKRIPGNDALAAAAAGGHLACVQQLLEVRAHASARNIDAATPLVLAAKGGHERVVACLLAAGATTRCCSQGLNAIQWADRRGHRHVVHQLEAHGCKLVKGALVMPGVDPQKNHLCPRRKGEPSTVHLATLRSREPMRNAELLGRCPELADQLEYALRVYCNDGDESVPLSQIPQLPAKSMLIRPREAVILRTPPPYNEWRTDDDETARMLKERKVKAKYSMAPGAKALPASQFVALQHDNPAYAGRRYLGEQLACFYFTRKKKSKKQPPPPANEGAAGSSEGAHNAKERWVVEALSFCRWMDDAPPAKLGSHWIDGDSEPRAEPFSSVESHMRSANAGSAGADAGSDEDWEEEEAEDEADADGGETQVHTHQLPSSFGSACDHTFPAACRPSFVPRSSHRIASSMTITIRLTRTTTTSKSS